MRWRPRFVTAAMGLPPARTIAARNGCFPPSGHRRSARRRAAGRGPGSFRSCLQGDVTTLTGQVDGIQSIDETQIALFPTDPDLSSVFTTAAPTGGDEDLATPDDEAGADGEWDGRPLVTVPLNDDAHCPRCSTPCYPWRRVI